MVVHSFENLNLKSIDVVSFLRRTTAQHYASKYAFHVCKIERDKCRKLRWPTQNHA
jgi:hypothetical protein